MGQAITLGGMAGVALLTVMCGTDDGAKVKIRPAHAEAGSTSGVITAGRGGSGMGTGGTANGMARGASGEHGGGEGGAGSPGASGGRDDRSGGTSATDGGAPTGGTSDPGASGSGGASATSGGSSTTTGGAGGTATMGGGGRGGSAGRGGTTSSGGSAGGTAGGAGGSCGNKTSCCDPDDPPCYEGVCPGGAPFCCDEQHGARIPCDPVTTLPDLVCLDSCSGSSFGTGSCASCIDAGDPPCSDLTWDAACKSGGSATCSDAAAGYRVRCSSDGGGAYYVSLVCTCSAGTACTPTPCCSPSSDACEATGCSADGGNCCDEASHKLDICSTLAGPVTVEEFICLNDCTGKSYGTESCAGCVDPADPPCDARHDWMSGCSADGPTTCSEPTAGYRLGCNLTIGPTGIRSPNVTILCTCDSGV